MKNLTIILLLTCWWGSTQAQYWEAIYGSENNEKIFCGIKAVKNNKGHAMTGYHNTGQYYNVYVVRTDVQGTIPASTSPYFNRTITVFLAPTFEKLSSVGKSIVEMKNGSGHAIAGNVLNDVLFMIVDNTGMPVTQMAYTANVPTEVFSIAESTYPNSSGDHDYYITGRIANTTSDILVLKVDKNGTIIWQNVIDLGTSNSRDDIAYDIIENPHNTAEVCLVGTTNQISGSTPISSFLINLNSGTGAMNSVAWFYNTSAQIILHSINEAYNPGNGFILGGTYTLDDADFLLINYDPQGAAINWTHHYDYTYAPGSNNTCMDAREYFDPATNTYHYYATGNVATNGAMGGDDIMVIKTDNAGFGVLNGEFTYGAQDEEYSASISVDSDHPKLTLGIYGGSNSFTGLGGYDFYVVRPYMDGDEVCNKTFRNSVEEPLSLSTSSLSDFSSTPFTTYNIYAEGEDMDYLIICEDGVRQTRAQTNSGNVVQTAQTALFSLYPNPTTGMVTIQSSSPATCLYEVLDMKGTVIQSGTITRETTLNISAQPAGIYMIKVIAADGTIDLQKLIRE